MPTLSKTGAGTVLSVCTTSSGTFIPILAVKTYSYSGSSIKYEDVTNFNSTVFGEVIVNEVIPSMAEPGSLTISGLFIPSDPGQLALNAGFADQALLYFKLQYPIVGAQTTTGNLATFAGFVQDNPLPDSDYSKPIAVKFAIKLNTMPVITAGS